MVQPEETLAEPPLTNVLRAAIDKVKAFGEACPLMLYFVPEVLFVRVTRLLLLPEMVKAADFPMEMEQLRPFAFTSVL
ncbi:MAG: hypothetical protein LBV30_08750 [Propionibacteriaceae bacterium]|nr:hypothetical protein [Propionibacteriaceae bacterium]